MSTQSKKFTKSENSEKPVVKVKPTVFPLGFSVSLIAGGPVIIEFIDVLNGVPTIIESVALPKEKTKALIAALEEAIDDDEGEN